MIRGVVFDLDHTLFDRYATLRRVLPEFYRHYRDKIPSGLSVEEFIERLILIEKRYIHYDWVKVFEMCSKDGIIFLMTEEERREAVRYLVYTCWIIAAVPYPFTAPTLKKLRADGYKLGIITNGAHKPQETKIKMLELEHLVDEIVITGDIGVHKPNPEPFVVMSERLGIPPNELMYVGDHPRNDVEGSRNAGYTPVWVKTTGYWCFDDIAHSQYEVDTVEQIPEILIEINK